jgi:hypothetical protein
MLVLDQLLRVCEIGLSAESVIEETSELNLPAIQATGLVEPLDPRSKTLGHTRRDIEVPVAPHNYG